MEIDESRIIREGEISSWWLGPLRQQLWAEAPFEDEGMTITRVHARTDVFAGFTGSDSQVENLAFLMPRGTLSGLARSENDPTRIQLACSVYVHDSIMSWLPEFLGMCSLLQLIEAYSYLEVEESLELRLDRTPHPKLGHIEYRDDALEEIILQIVAAGTQVSRFIGDDMRALLGDCQNPPCVLATGEDVGVTAEFPFLGRTSLTRFSAIEKNPKVGSGLLITLKIPDKPANGVMHALEMNECELKYLTRSHFLGSWCSTNDGTPTFASFVPNAIWKPGLAQYLMQSMMMRAMWVAEAVYGDDWAAGGYQQAMEQKSAMLDLFTGHSGTQTKPNRTGFLSRLFKKGGR